MTKHTPGPWHYLVDPEGKFGIYPEGGKFLAITDYEANARLIAAAPFQHDHHEMILGMVQEALRYLDSGDLQNGRELLIAIAGTSRAAIAKAESTP